jgi:DNA-binding NarL/FixJ family response regulator
LPRFQCIIADDHAIVRQGLRSVLEAPGMIEEDGIDVVAEAANGIETIAALRKLRPHLLLLDVQMPFAGWAEVAVEVRSWSPETRILRGGRVIAPDVQEVIAGAPEQSTLSARERQVLNMIAMGRSNRDMAELLGISAKTVDRHRTNLMQKLDVHSVAQLIALALREWLIDGSDAL